MRAIPRGSFESKMDSLDTLLRVLVNREPKRKSKFLLTENSISSGLANLVIPSLLMKTLEFATQSLSDLEIRASTRILPGENWKDRNQDGSNGGSSVPLSSDVIWSRTVVHGACPSRAAPI